MSAPYTIIAAQASWCLCRHWPVGLPSCGQSSLCTWRRGKGIPKGEERDIWRGSGWVISLTCYEMWQGNGTGKGSGWWPFLEKCAAHFPGCGSHCGAQFMQFASTFVWNNEHLLPCGYIHVWRDRPVMPRVFHDSGEIRSLSRNSAELRNFWEGWCEIDQLSSHCVICHGCVNSSFAVQVE